MCRQPFSSQFLGTSKDRNQFLYTGKVDSDVRAISDQILDVHMNQISIAAIFVLTKLIISLSIYFRKICLIEPHTG